MSKKVLLIEDDPDIVDILRMNLPRHGYQLSVAMHGVEGLHQALEQDFDLLILDLMLPGIDGLEICRKIRAENVDVFIIIITGRDGETDTVVGLELGADDYLTKPFSVAELVARMNVLFRRAEQSQKTSANNQILRFGPLVIEPENRRVLRSGKELFLTAMEFDLLLFLARHPGRPFSRDELVAQVWDSQATEVTGTVNAQLSRLRKRLEVDPKNPQFIKTVWGIGYQFCRAEDFDESEV